MTESKSDINDLQAHAVLAKNDLANRSGHSPSEWAIGRRHKLPVDITEDEMPLSSLSFD